MELANTLAYYDKSNNYCRKEFIVQPPGGGGLNFKEFMDPARGIV